jgi:hypothetical protein
MTILQQLANKKLMIQWGGCGFFAKSLYTILDKMGMDVQLVVLYNIPQDEKTVERLAEYDAIIEADSPYDFFNDTPWQHIMVLVDKTYFVDNSAIIHREDFIRKNLVYGRMSYYFLEQMLDEEFEYAWNDCFNRKDVPTIEKHLLKLVA